MNARRRSVPAASRPDIEAPRLPDRDQALARLEWDTAVGLFIEGWAADHPGIRPRTLSLWRQPLETRLVPFARERGVSEVSTFSRYDLRAFVAWLEDFVTFRGKPLTPRGKQMALDAAKGFFRWLYDEGLIADDVSVHVRRYRLDRDLEPRATPGPDLEKILSVFDLRTPTGGRNTSMVYLMAFCGLRVSELVGLDAGDLDLRGGRIRVKAETSKGRRTRFVDLPLTIDQGQQTVRPEVASVLTLWFRVRRTRCPHLGDRGALFVTLRPPRSAPKEPGTCRRQPGIRLTVEAVRNILARAADKAGVDRRLVMPHRLRHHFGLMSAKAGVPTTALMRAMGHRSPLMTARYSEFADSERSWAFARADITRGVRFPALESGEPEATADAGSGLPVTGN